MEHSKKKIEEAISHWSMVLLENQMATPDEVAQLIGEGKVKKLFAKMRDIASKTTSAVKNAAEALHDIVRPNKGVKMLRAALAKLAKHGVDVAKVDMWASFGDTQFYPVEDFFTDEDDAVILVADPSSEAKPKTLRELQTYLVKALKLTGHVRLGDVVKSISLAKKVVPGELSESEVLLEYKLDDYIKKNKLDMKAAMSGDAYKEIKRTITKQNDAKTKEAIKRAFSRIKSAEKPMPKPKPSKKPAPKPSPKKAEAKPTAASPSKLTVAVLDNELLDVIPKKTSVGFKFSKPKAELEIDYAFS